jgi:glycosyltransferase involved in cell wall biosynthesis
MSRIRVAFLGPTPPPVMGPSIATRIVLDKPPPDDIELVHVETADRRDLHTLGRIDLGNIWQAIRIHLVLFWTLLVRWPHLVYVPISQTPVGYLRDSGLILLARLFRRRVVLHLRGGNFDEFYERAGPLLRAWVRWTLRRAQGVIVLGECLRPQFRPFFDEDEIHVVPNGADFPELPCAERSYEGRSDFRLYYLGNLLPIKGAGDLVRALPAIFRRHPAATATLSGDAADPEFARWVAENVAGDGLAERVTLTGRVDRAAKLRRLAEADLFVYPSHYEGHPWVVVEAMAAGLPIVSCDVGCVRECVVDGRNGCLVPVARPEYLARTVADLLDSPRELERMSRESLRIYRANFTESHFRRRLFDAMRKVVHGDPAPARTVPQAQA